jgi:hypothetical protein
MPMKSLDKIRNNTPIKLNYFTTPLGIEPKLPFIHLPEKKRKLENEFDFDIYLTLFDFFFFFIRFNFFDLFATKIKYFD